MNKFTIIKEVKDPEILVVTPLWIGHKISKLTRKTIKRNDVPYTWIISEGQNNIPTNVSMGLEWYKQKYHKLPQFYFPLDRDVILGRHLFDRLYRTLSTSKSEVAFSYSSFAFRGHMHFDFPAKPYDINRLLQHNYISSNSLFRSEVTEKVGLVKDEKYKRLLDWAFLLKLFNAGYYGEPCPVASFIVQSTESDISSGTKPDYELKRERVIVDFVKPIIDKLKEGE